MPTEEYVLSFPVQWADLDPNGHLRHSAYNDDYATHVRFSYLQECGFGPDQFAKVGIGPVILREETRFLAEIRMGATIRIDFQLRSASADFRRFSLFHGVFGETSVSREISVTQEPGNPAATVIVDGGWLDLTTRKLVAPPSELAQTMRRLPRTKDYALIEG